jgi:signal transduction histidine kinase/ligand-binding sensor domain-containing protein/DNA-binding response OmpR family regulator
MPFLFCHNFSCSYSRCASCKQTFYFTLFSLLLTIVANGQVKCKVEYYSTEQGLSHQAVTTMIKDREGFMWFGSWDGINRFDGHSFVSFKSSPGDRSQLRNDRIDQIVDDQADHLWILAYDRQVYRFDKKTEQFLPLLNIITSNSNQKISFYSILSANNGFVWIQSLNDGLFCVRQNDVTKGHFLQYKKGFTTDFHLPSNTVNFFHEDQAHRIWIGTPEGLCCLEHSKDGTYENSKTISVDAVSAINVTSVDEDATNLYFGAANGSLITFDKKANNFTIQKIPVGSIRALLRSKKGDVIYATTSLGEIVTANLRGSNIKITRYKPSEALGSIYEDRSGKLWIEPEKFGVIQFNPVTTSFRNFSKKIEDPNGVLGERFKVFEDNNGIVWIKMKGGGFGYYNSEKSSMEYTLDAADTPGYRLPNIVYYAYYDNAGILWLRVYGRQLVKIIFQANDFKQQRVAVSDLGVGDNEIRGILYDNKNRLWLGAKSGKLYIRQNNKWIKDLFVNEPAKGLGQVYTIYEDSHANIWLGTKRNGLYKAIPLNTEATKYRLVNFLADEKNSSGLTSNQIYSLLEDASGRMWVGTFDKGLFLAVGAKDSIKFVQSGNALKNYPKENFQKIRHMALDAGGNIWIGTTNGLLVLDANDSHSPVYRYTTYSKIPGDSTSLGNNDIQFIYRDSKNRMWLATSGGGFCQAIRRQPFQSFQFKNYTTKDGMPNDYVLSCAEGKQGNLWFATENGLSKFNPENKLFRNYDTYDGLPTVGFSEASASKGSNGTLFFGTTDGYLSFNPERINLNRIQTSIALTNLQINNEDVRPGTPKSVLETAINYTSKLTLDYNQNIISIDYAILDYRAGNRQAFSYRLIGFDSMWHDDRQLRRATYTNLPPGNYTFEVKSLSTDLYSATPYKRLAITILSPPWKTWWAYLLYTIFFATLLFFIRRYAVAMIRLRNKIVVEQKLAALKLNFFTNVSHELRTPLTLIVNPLEQLARKEKLSAEGESYLDVARKNANRMVRFINQLLDLRKVQSEKATLKVSRVEIVTFVKKISDYFAEAARMKQISLEISNEQKEVVAWVDAEKLDVVVYNLLGNAIKFTPAGKAIRISIQTLPDQRSFSIAVSDEGPGVAKDKLEDIFELFHEEEHVNSRELKGTGIGLSLCREFVNLHGGKIWAENNDAGGLTVAVELKLGLEHYKQKEVSFIDLPAVSPAIEKSIEQQLLSKAESVTASKDEDAPLVLLVEDNDELRSFIKGQLGEFYRVQTAENGEEGLQKAISIFPDLIVSDIMMPKMDGVQMLDKLKNDIHTSHIPVVLLSAKHSIESQIEGLKYGADYYITKPFNNEFLIAAINNLLLQRKKLFTGILEKKKSIELSPEPVIITSKDESFLKDVIQIVESKMSDTDFNIDAVAESIAMSRTTFYKKFKSLTGLAPIEFVRDMRLQRAKQLLDAGGSNISEVAYTVGFNNPKYFSTCFKEKYHCSPSEYLKSHAV